MRNTGSRFVLVVLLCAVALASGASAQAATVTPISLNEDPTVWGLNANEPSSNACAISGNGAFVAFESKAVNLVAGDRNGLDDVYLGSATGVSRISLRVGGDESRRRSYSPDLSDTGRYAVFLSTDDLLGTAGGAEQPNTVFHLDTQTGTLLRAANTTGGIAALVSDAPRISGNGRYVVFISADSTIVAGDTNGRADVFRYDTQTNTTIRVNTTAGGAESTGTVGSSSGPPSISSGGDVIAFVSSDSNLVSGDTNGRNDVFVKNVVSGVILRASQSNAGVGGDQSSLNARLSANATYVVFQSPASNLVSGDTNGLDDIFRYHNTSNTIERVSVGSLGEQNSNGSRVPSVSATGQFVHFESLGSSFGGTGTMTQLFRRDMATGTTTRLTDYASGVTESRVNDGAAVACFSTIDAHVSGDTNQLRDIYRLDIATSALTRRSAPNVLIPVVYGSGATELADLTADATRVVATTSAPDMDADSFAEFSALQSNSTSLSQVAQFTLGTGAIDLLARVNGTGPLPGGSSTAYTLSSNGQWLGFSHGGADLDPRTNGGFNAYRQALPQGVPELINLGLDNIAFHGFNVGIDADGTRVSFLSSATNLVPGDTNSQTDAFVWDMATGIRRVNVSSTGDQSNGITPDLPYLSDDGQWVVFSSSSTNLVANDTNGMYDVFLHDLTTSVTQRVSVDSTGAQRPQNGTDPAISPNGRYVAYYYGPFNTIGPDYGIYIYDRIAATTTPILLPAGMQATNATSAGPRFSYDSRFVTFVAERPGSTHATGSAQPHGATNDIFLAMRYDIVSGSLRELFRTTTNPFVANAAPYSLGNLRAASGKHAVITTNQPLGEFDRNGDKDIALITFDPGTIGFAVPTVSIGEGAGTVQINVVRSGAAEGAVEAVASFVPQSATLTADFAPTATFATWADNENATRQYAATLVDDALMEGNETFLVQLNAPTGGADLGAIAAVLVTIVDNDLGDPIFANGFE